MTRAAGEARREPPSPLVLLAVLLTVIAGLGEWKVVNSALGALPKAVSLGVPALAAAAFLVRPDMARIRRCRSVLPVYLLYIAVLLMWSLGVWMHDLTQTASIVRGVSKLLYQCAAILFAVGFVYLCGERAADAFFAAMAMTNALIALLELPGYGLMQSVRSVIDGIVSYGNAAGYMRALEIHDVTFLFGQFFVYYAALAPRGDARRRRGCRVRAAAAMAFMLLGLKRTAIPAALLWSVLAAFLLRRRRPVCWIVALGAAMIVLFWVYLAAIRSGLLFALTDRLGIDTMGRAYLWQLAEPYYSLSPAFAGQGFEAVDAIVSGWYHDGLLTHAYPFHNDILKVYVELGFFGFLLWAAVLYLVHPLALSRALGERAAVTFFCLLGYMSVTYLTDNTAFYYWSCIGLRLIPLAAGLRPDGEGGAHEKGQTAQGA